MMLFNRTKLLSAPIPFVLLLTISILFICIYHIHFVFSISENTYVSMNETDSINKEGWDLLLSFQNNKAINMFNKVLDIDQNNIESLNGKAFLNLLTMTYENQGIDKPNSSVSNSNNQKSSTKAKRLTFSYENNNIKLIDEQKIDKIIPPSIPLTELENKRVNFLLEVSDNKNNTIYRQIIDNQIKTDIEIFSDEPKESISRKELSEIKGIFSVVIPDQPQAESLDIFKSRDFTGKARESIREDTNKIFHLNLKSKEDNNNK